MSKLPDYVSYAFEQLGYEDYEKPLALFVNRWGGLDVETFVRVLKTAKSAESGELFLGLPNFEQSRLTVRLTESAILAATVGEPLSRKKGTSSCSSCYLTLLEGKG